MDKFPEQMDGGNLTRSCAMKRAMLWTAMLAVMASAVGIEAQDKAAAPQAQQNAPAQSPSAASPAQNPAAQAGDLTGNWQGTVAMGNGQRVLIKLTKDGAQGSAYKGILYMIDNGGQAFGVPAIAVHGIDVSFTVSTIGLNYTGTLNPNGASIAGNAKMADSSMHELNLNRVTGDAVWAIPEAPKPMAKDAKPGFEVATIKPGQPGARGKNIGFRGRHLMLRNFNVDDLLALAYGLHTKQITGAPDWFNSELFDVDGVPDVEGVPSQAQQGIMMQKLLADRFALKFHKEQRELSVFAITLAKGGPKMQVTAAGPDDGIGFGFRNLGDLSVHNMTVATFAVWFQGSVTDRPVVDQTGLKDRYDFTLKWTPDESQFAQFRSAGATVRTTDDPNAPPALNDAMQQQLGLRIEPVKTMDDVIVIDHADHPSAN
jgi:uncharacterized protein (TIGR03435 family)